MTHFTDRSRYEVGLKCPRKLFWNYYASGRGFIPVGDKPELTFGLAVHAAMEQAATGRVQPAHDLLAFTDPTPDGYTMGDELESLYQGLAATFERFTLPRLLDEYAWVSSEEEMNMEIARGITWMTRLDGVLRRKSDGLLFVLEAKTSSFPDDLAAQAPFNFQLLMEVETLRRTMKEPVGGAILLVFNKGSKRAATAKEKEQGRDGYRRLSPFTYWYGREYANGDREYRLDWAKGWDRIPVWTIPNWYEIGVENFEEEFRSQIQVWPSVDADAARVEEVIRQVVWRERTIRANKPFLSDGETIDMLFPQNFGNCMNDGGFRRPCPYVKCCFSPMVASDPEGSGLYEVRRPNHPQEVNK